MRVIPAKHRSVRTFTGLGLAGALVLSLAVGGPASAAIASDEYDSMREGWAEMLTGGDDYDPQDVSIAARIAAIDASAQATWDSMDTTTGRSHLWSDLTSATDSSQLTTAYSRLRELAVAVSTTGSQLHADTALIGDIVGGLEWMQQNRYNMTVAKIGNWWDWELGAPMALGDTVILMYDELTPAQVGNYMAPANRFSPTVTTTGANRAWKAEVVAITGVLTKNTAKLTNARNGMSQLFDYVTTGDGFYQDGSFIQHDSVAYTGSYGRSLLATVADLLALLDGTQWEVVDADVANVYSWVGDSFEPVVHDGALMDMVRGREITRHYYQELDAGRGAMEAILTLAESAPTSDAMRYRSMLKEWLSADAAASFLAGATVTGIVRAQAVLADSGVVPRGPLNAYRQFANMDRAVASRPGWALGISMSSSRVGLYESINGENLSGWYTGAGATYLYNDDHGYYGDGYWPTVNPYRLPGTTVDVQSRTPGTNSSHRSSRDWVGGVALDGLYGATGMEYDDVSSDLLAKKSWFVLDDEVVALGAGVRSTSGRSIETTVENRMLNDAGSNAVRVDGLTLGDALSTTETTHSAVDRLHIAGETPGSDIGYYFPEPTDLTSVREARTATWKAVDNRPTTPTTPVTRNYQTFWVDHGINPDTGYAYTMLPGMSSSEVDDYAASPEVEVLANSVWAQGVEEAGLGIQAANFWTGVPTTVGLITSDSRASVMLQQDGGEIAVAISDPTQANTGTIQIDLAVSAAGSISLDPRITVLQLSPTIKLQVDVSGADGAGIEARFSEAPTSEWNLVSDELGDFSAGWSVYGPSTTVVQGSGFVTVSDGSQVSSGSMFQSSFQPPAGSFTIEARIRTHDGLTGFSARGGDFLVKADLLHGASGAVRDATLTRSHTLDTTVWHIYRMVVHADRSYDLYVDGVPVFIGAPAGAGGTNILSFGIGAAQTGTLDIDFVRAGTGAIVP